MTQTVSAPAERQTTQPAKKKRFRAEGILLLVLLAAVLLFGIAGRGNLRATILRLRGWPESLIALMARNPETRDFVLDWKRQGGTEPARTLDESAARGTPPLLLQWDARWGYAHYGSDFLAITGCGPTCLAMAYSGVSGKSDVTPYTVALMAEKGGYYVPGIGTAWTLMTDGAQALGISGSEISPDRETLRSALERGSILICSMKPGDFTAEGHFIVLCGIDGDERTNVYDPNSVRRSKPWDLETLSGQMAAAWEYRT